MEATLPFWHARRVLVTGCTGFLGTWVVRELLARGAEVAGLIRADLPDSDLIRDTELADQIWVVRGPVEDGPRLRQTLAVHEIDTVFHLAAPPDGLDPTGFVRRTWLHAIADAAHVAAPNATVVTAYSTAERVLAERTGGTAHPVAVALLPTVFGGGDRRTDRLVPRTAAAVANGVPVPPPTRRELAEPLLFAPDAARLLLDFTEDAATHLHQPAGPVDLTPADCPTGTEVFAALTGRPMLARPIVAGRRVTAVSLSASYTLSWHDARTETVPVSRAA
ncbi:MAG: NAD-dependent epimerase/dehydratase family protein [Fimbriiglobus sp.]